VTAASALGSLALTSYNTVVRARVLTSAANGAIGSSVLDDTNSVVPAGATKVRVLHLAPSAGTLQVYRTQPDYQQPIQ
jgi:hypothetical protein